jgi:hypothetical protein
MKLPSELKREQETQENKVVMGMVWAELMEMKLKTYTPEDGLKYEGALELAHRVSAKLLRIESFRNKQFQNEKKQR